MPTDTVKQMVRFLGLKKVDNLSNLLGFPLSFSNKNVKSYNFILDRLRAKLMGLRAKLLSMMHRGILINSLVATIPSYFMQCTYLICLLVKS